MNRLTYYAVIVLELCRFKITMNVIDSDGLVRGEDVLIVPEKVDVNFSSNVPGGIGGVVMPASI